MPTTTRGRREAARDARITGGVAAYESLRLTWWRALNLSYHGWRDRRAGLPAPPGAGRPPAPTPCVTELDRHRLEVLEAEREHLVRATAQLRVEVRRVNERVRQAARTTGPRSARQDLRLAELLRSRAVLEERIARECATAQRRALRFDEFMRRCCARYARTLLRRHPDGPQLAQCGWPTLGEVPVWVLDPWPPTGLLPSGPDGAS